ncbi:MAG: tetratricopeptide repeat protein [Myxococcota bacterium]
MCPRTAIPVALTERFGQTETLQALQQALAAGVRLLALVGPPGVGKTRLIVDALSASPHEVLWLDASGREEADLMSALLRALDVVPPPGRRDAVIARALAMRPSVMVIDGVEAMLDFLAPHVSAWLAAAPALTVVLGSRRRPDWSEAQIIRAEPLAPEAARAMLCDRVLRAGGPDLTSDQDPSPLTDLVHRLDGLPLAIELIARRVAIMGIALVQQQLTPNGALGQHTSTPHPESRRHDPLLDLTGHALGGVSVSLRRALEASWAGFDEDTQSTLRIVSLFARDFVPQDLAALAPHGDWITALETLEADSWLAHHRTAQGQTRMRLYGAMKAFAQERFRALEPEPRRALQAQFRAALASLSIDAIEQLQTPEGLDGLQRLRDRRADIEAHARSRDRPSTTPPTLEVLQIKLAEGVLAAHDRADQDAQRVLQQVFDLASSSVTDAHTSDLPLRDPGDIAAAAVCTLASLQLTLDRKQVPHVVEMGHAVCAPRPHRHAALQYELLRVHLSNNPSHAAPIENMLAQFADNATELAVRLRVLLGIARLWAGELPEARRLLDEALSHMTHVGGPVALSWTLENRGVTLLWQDRPDLACADLERAIALSKQIGPRNLHLLKTMSLLGWTYLDLGALNKAQSILEDAALTADVLDTGDVPWSTLNVCLPLGMIAAERGALDVAEQHYRTLLAAHALDDVHARAWLEMAALACQNSQFAAAQAAFEKAQALAPQTPFAVAATSGRAACLAAQGDFATAYTELKIAQRGSDEIGMSALSVHVQLDAAEVVWHQHPGQPHTETTFISALTAALQPEGTLPPLWQRTANIRRRGRRLLALMPSDLRTHIIVAAADPDAQHFVFDTEQIRFRCPGGHWFDTGRKRLLGRLLRTLFNAHHAGEPASFDDLIAAGWPNESIPYDAAANRLHKALSQLRKLPGVREHLTHRDEGWQLTPHIAQLRLPL